MRNLLLLIPVLLFSCTKTEVNQIIELPKPQPEDTTTVEKDTIYHDLFWVDPMKESLKAMEEKLVNELKPWVVPDRVFPVEDFGAVNDGITMNTQSIQAAIDKCSASGGGVVLFSSGDYVTGTFVIKSGVMIEVSEGARILGSTNIEDYPEMIEEFKSVNSENYKFRQSLIYAEKANKIGIRGKGEIFFRGGKENFSSPETTGSIDGRPMGIRMIQCNNIVVQDIFLHDAASWMQNYIACNDLIFERMHVENQCNYNNDGLDPDGCKNVIIRDCLINAEDDAMCLKSGSGLPCENVLIEDCEFYSTCNAFKLGTDTQSDFKNIVMRNVKLGGVPEPMFTDRGRQASTGLTLATVDGGNAFNILIHDIIINQSRCPIFIRIGDRGRVMPGQPRPEPGKLSNIVIENVYGNKNFRQGSFISGIKDHCIEEILIRNCHIEMEGGGSLEMIEQTVPESEGGYPDAHQFCKNGLPSYGFYVRHARNITFDSVSVSPVKVDMRPETFNGGDIENIVYNGELIK